MKVKKGKREETVGDPKPEKGISAGYVEHDAEALSHEHEMKAKALESHELGEKIEEKEKEERPKEEETAKESKSVEDAGEISTNPEAEQALKEAEERTVEEKQKQHEEAYGMSDKPDFPEFTKEELQREEEQTHAAAELQRKTPLVIRESLINFVIEQEMLLRIHDEAKGVDGWLDAHPLYLLAKLMEESGELAESLMMSRSATTIRREAADVGNIAMMIAHKAGKL